MAANPSIQLGTDGNWGIKEDNLLAYKKDGNRFFNKEFDFSRGSSATYVAKDGLIKTAGIQPNSVLNGDFSQEGAELIVNGGFDTNSDWSIVGTSVISNGKYEASGLTAYGFITSQSPFTATSGKTYKVVFEVSDYVQGAIRPRIYGGVGVSVSSNGVHTQYVQAGSSDTIFSFLAWSGDAFVGSIDNVSVKEVGQNWEITQGTVGDNKASFSTTDGSFAAIKQLNAVTIGKTYKYSFEILSITGTVTFDLTGGNSGVDYTAVGVKQGQMTATSPHVEIKRKFGVNNTSAEITNISVQEIQVDIPRIDFSDSPDGTLLLEPSSTNLFHYSEDFSNSYWSKINSTISLFSEKNPQGNLSIYKLTEDNSTNTHMFSKSFSVTANVDYNLSFFVKKADYDYIQFGFGANYGNTHSNINLTNGNVESENGQNAKVESFGNGWYRVSATKQASNTTGYWFVTLINSANAPRNQSYQGDGVSGTYVWGAQLEQNFFATSYIPTYGTTATRLREVCTNSGSEQDFNQTEGVLFVEAKSIGDSNSWREVAIGRGNYTQRVVLSFTNTNKIRAQVDSAGGQFSYSDSGGDIDIKAMHKYAIKYKPNDFSFFVDGIKIAQDNSGNTFDSNLPLESLAFTGIGSGSGSAFYGKTKNLKVFKRALSDTELYLLTSEEYESYQAMATALNYTI